ncbi:MAG: hypothetical protein HYU30_02355 [Chloroflexi bacterium]|nr:hypothetical protein [Chloroflexota bacterium]
MLDEILDQVEAYLGGLTTLRELEFWVMDSFDAVMGMGDWDAMVLANDLDADLVEVKQGRLSEDALKDSLREKLSALRKA